MHKIDPTLIFYYSKELKQMILEGQGEQHINIAKWQIETLEKIPVEFLTFQKFNTEKPLPKLQSQCIDTKNNQVVQDNLVKFI
jgi:translation elongation factor EF-G